VNLLNKQNCHYFSFVKSENKMVEQDLSGGLIQVGERKRGEKLWKGEYSANTVYTCM
jgi:hypothetical protein